MQTQTKNPEPTGTPIQPAPDRGHGRRWWIPAAFAAAIAVIVGASVLGDGQSDPAPVAEPGTAIELSLGESDALASCLAFDPAVLATFPMAFQGTATEVDGTQVTLDVDRWFSAGDADVVRLVGEHTSPALIAGFDFVPGSQYLISASGGSVNYCGYSGAVSPELLSGYEAAFPTS